MLRRYLARQFARPHGLVGRWLIAPWLDRINQGMNRLTIQLLDVCPGERVLEVGFGGGALLAMILARRPAEAIGVDISEAVVARGRSRFAGQARIMAGSAESLPIEDGGLDAVCSLNAIYFWANPQRAMREFARVLKPNGRLVLGFEAPETLCAWPGHRFGFRIYDAPEVVALAKAAGFGDAEVHEGVEPKFGRIICVKLKRL